MLNEERKLRFFKEYGTSATYKNVVANLITKIAKYEDEVNKDIAEFDEDTMSRVLKEHAGFRAKNIRYSRQMIRAYVLWCKQNGYKTTKAIFTASAEPCDRIREEMVSSPTHLKSVLNIYFEPSKEETVDVVYRTYLWLAFIGLPVDHAIEITKGCIDLGQKTITYNGSEYSIYDEAMTDISAAYMLDEFWFKSVNVKKRKRVGGKRILRGFSESIDKKALQTLIARKTKDRAPNSPHPTYTGFYISGIFYRQYLRELDGDDISFEDVIQCEIDKGMLSVAANRSAHNQTVRDYCEDYQNWKKAFSLN